jgi:hypothetical protein
MDPLRLKGNGENPDDWETSDGFRMDGSGRVDIDEIDGSGVTGVASSRLLSESATAVGELSNELFPI